MTLPFSRAVSNSRSLPAFHSFSNHTLYRSDDTRPRDPWSWRVAALCVAAGLIGVAGSARADTGVRAYAQLEGQLGLPKGPLAQNLASVTPGFQLAFGIGPRSLPVTFGLGAGVMVLDQSSPGRRWTVDSNDFAVSHYTYTASMDVRHLELLVRVEPDFPWIRPFAEASVGGGALWLSVSDDSGDAEQQQDVALTRGWALGVDLDPWHPAHRKSGDGGFVLTLGVRDFEIGTLQYYRTNPSGGAPLPAGGTLNVLAPFVALTLAGWS